MGGAKGYGDMTGQRFGKWTVLGMTARTSTDGHRRTACLCRCDCGTERVVYAQSLRGGLTKSCGCAKPVPSAGRRPKAEKTGAQSDPVGDDWMFGKMGSKGLFAKKR
jgi:hypothetical protein